VEWRETWANCYCVDNSCLFTPSQWNFQHLHEAQSRLLYFNTPFAISDQLELALNLGHFSQHHAELGRYFSHFEPNGLYFVTIPELEEKAPENHESDDVKDSLQDAVPVSGRGVPSGPTTWLGEWQDDLPWSSPEAIVSVTTVYRERNSCDSILDALFNHEL